MSISAEMILLLISMISNVVIIFSKRIKLIYSPCCYVSCDPTIQDDDDEDDEDENKKGILKRIVSKLTPRRVKQDKSNDLRIKPDNQTEMV